MGSFMFTSVWSGTGMPGIEPGREAGTPSALDMLHWVFWRMLAIWAKCHQFWQRQMEGGYMIQVEKDGGLHKSWCLCIRSGEMIVCWDQEYVDVMMFPCKLYYCRSVCAWRLCTFHKSFNEPHSSLEFQHLIFIMLKVCSPVMASMIQCMIKTWYDV